MELQTHTYIYIQAYVHTDTHLGLNTYMCIYVYVFVNGAQKFNVHNSYVQYQAVQSTTYLYILVHPKFLSDGGFLSTSL